MNTLHCQTRNSETWMLCIKIARWYIQSTPALSNTRYLEHRAISNKTLGPSSINSSGITTRYLELPAISNFLPGPLRVRDSGSLLYLYFPHVFRCHAFLIIYRIGACDARITCYIDWNFSNAIINISDFVFMVTKISSLDTGLNRKITLKTDVFDVVS